MQATPDTSIVRDLVFLVIGAIIGAVLGFIGSYWVQRSAQNRAWKREYILKNVGEIFAPLYEEIHLYKNEVEKFNFLPQSIRDSNWNTIRNDYRDLFIEDILRDKLNRLYDSEFSRYNNNFWEVSRKIADIWFGSSIKKKVEADGHTFTKGPSSSKSGRIFTINIEKAKRSLTAIVRKYASKYIFLNDFEQKGVAMQKLKHNLKCALSEKEYIKELQVLKEEVDHLPDIQEFKRFNGQIMNELNGIKNMLKERIKKPYEAKL